MLFVRISRAVATAKSRLRFVMVALLLAASAALLTSYIHALLQPGNSTYRLRTGLWLRDHWMSGPVDALEWCWYTLRRSSALRGVQPPRPSLHEDRLVTRRKLTAPLAPPRALACLVPSCAPDEGVWTPVGARVRDSPALYVAYFRPDAAHDRVWAAGALIDQTRVRTELVAGLHEPLDFHGGWGGVIPFAQRGRLVAAFNGGFRFADAAGGFYAEGRMGMPLRDGAASLVVYRDGSANVGAWGDDVRMSSNVLGVRQNLRPIVALGRVVDGLERNAHGEWGAGRNQGLYTWRSGLGSTAAGALVYVAGDGLTLSTLAKALTQAGCIRGMELDIHDEWITFEVYARSETSSDGVISRKLLPGMAFDDRRYLLPDDKDFVALFAR
jgi:hypothetical protein